jgi:hypothetical protein
MQKDWIKILGGVISLGLILALFWISLDQLRFASNRGRFVVAVVRDSLQSLQHLPDPAPLILSQRGWPDGFLSLQTWFIREAFLGTSPQDLRLRLNDMSEGRMMSSTLRMSLQRWDTALDRWERVRSTRDTTLPDSLLVEGRTVYHEADGYFRQGYSYDATVHYVWAIRALSRFIEFNPIHMSVPEALHLTSEALLRVRQALTGPLRSGRLIHLCVEQYPDTVWATLSRSLWREEMRGTL